MVAKKQKLTKTWYNDLLKQGAWNNLPYRAVIGDQNSFYLWRQREVGDRGSSTVWIRGKEAFELLNKLRQEIVKGKQQFAEAFDKAFESYPPMRG